jgi:hypothetical protein
MQHFVISRVGGGMRERPKQLDLLTFNRLAISVAPAAGVGPGATRMYCFAAA